jgi:hypothetical protein
MSSKKFSTLKWDIPNGFLTVYSMTHKINYQIKLQSN